MSGAKISVIIPFYNAFNLLGDTITSVIHQSYKNLEIILVDDGSTDISAEIIKKFSDPRIQYIYQENKGAASARNVGLMEASGDYIQFLDSDDVLHREKIQKQVDALTDHPKGTVAMGAWGKFIDDFEQAGIHPEPVWKDYSKSEQWLVESWLGGGMMQTACWLVPKKVADDAGPWNENLSLHDDGEYFTRVLIHAESVKFVPDAMVYYRQVSGSLSRIRSQKAIESAYTVTDLSSKHLLQKDSSDLARKACARHYGRFAYEFYHSNPALANEALAKSYQLYSSRNLNVGPPKFNALVSLLGLGPALRLKSIFQK